MRFKDFEIRPVLQDFKGNCWDGRYELVKWTELKDNQITPNFCFVVAFIEYNPKEPCWELQSVGMRLMQYWVEGLDEWILAWCDMATVCMEDNE